MNVDASLLKKHCEAVSIAGLTTNADLEGAASELYACVQDHNDDKRKIEALK